MVKAKTVYVCSNCGADSPKWIGKCPSCGEWNTYVEEIVVKEPVGKRALYGVSDGGKVRPVLLRDITSEEETRVDLGDRELNRVLGGGLVKGSQFPQNTYLFNQFYFLLFCIIYCFLFQNKIY